MAGSAAAGLSAEEAAARLRQEGPNEIPSQERRNWFKIFLDVMAEPMFALLLAASAIYFVLGDFAEAVALTLFATFSVSIALIQEIRSERILAALRDMTSPRALVIRDGRRVRIPGRDVVRGDIVLLAEGDRVPADAWLLSGDELMADESLLTGESVPVRKHPSAEAPKAGTRPGGDDLPTLFSGTLIVRGQGRAEVVATGHHSEIGKIGTALRGIKIEVPRLRAQTRTVVRIFAMVGLTVSVVAGLLYGLARSSWLDGVLSGIAVGMSMLPEEFPLVLAVFMVMGAWRIAQARVLTRRAASIETLGAVTVLCTDKTGTLTENKMRVADVEGADGSAHVENPHETKALPKELEQVLRVATLAGLRDPFDPMDRALHTLWQQRGRTAAEIFAERDLLHHQGVSPNHLAVTRAWKKKETGALVAATKGAPEAVIARCDLTQEQAGAVLRRASDLAAQGKRVLAVAEARAENGTAVEDAIGRPFRFLGLVAFEDPLRANVPAAIAECRRAGVRVVMITGDYPGTARAIARKAGLNADAVASGTDIAELSGEQLRDVVRRTDVFARILPEQKLRLVEALKANGEVVGMTGDGVNDAPSLRAAHIGVAMGGRGTDVAREASSIVLLDDDFASLVKTIRLGRRIYDNLRKAMGYILAVHVPIAGLALLPVAFGMPMILTPALIGFLEMIIDPACSIVFEAESEERDLMRRPPRSPSAQLLTPDLIVRSLSQGALALVAAAAVFVVANQEGRSGDDVRGLMLVTISLLNFALIFTNRSFDSSIGAALTRPNAWLWIGAAAVTAILTIVFLAPGLRETFRLGTLHANDLSLAFGAALLFTVVAIVMRRTTSPPRPAPAR